jgi:3-(3-hydroxy-phenyl)propionate hydroxylase
VADPARRRAQRRERRVKPAGKGPRESLYFDYPDFAFERPPELDGATPLHPVLIAGAGPVGLVAAIALARRGVPSVVVDARDSVNDGSRAICVSRHSFETLQQLDAVQPFLAKALGWTRGRCYFRDREFYRLEMPHTTDERYLPMYNLQQQYIELFLVEQARRYPQLIRLLWQCRVESVSLRAPYVSDAGRAPARQSGSDVELGLHTPAGPCRLRGRWLLAADGARSTVRAALGLELRGENLPGEYVIVDVKMRHDFPTERRSFFESSARPEGTVLIHRQPDDIWRLDYQLQPGEDREQALREESIRASVRAILAAIGHTGEWELEWWSIYTANTLCLDDYRHGRVLFIGDSAHIVPIFGVRGLNNGIADAVNAAWKLAAVMAGEAPEALLDSYSPERRAATLDVFANAGRSARFMTPPTRGHAVLRKTVLELAQTQDFCRRFADPRQVQPSSYAASPLTGFPARDREFVAGPAAGTALANRRIADGDFLLDRLGAGFTALYFSADGTAPEALRAACAAFRCAGEPVRLLVVARAEARVDDGDVVPDPEGRLAALHGAVDGTLYLLRPDRYVAARWLHADPVELQAALGAALGGPADA